MAKLSYYFRTCGLIFILIFNCELSALLQQSDSYELYKSCGNNNKCYGVIKTLNGSEKRLWFITPASNECSELPKEFELNEVGNDEFESITSEKLVAACLNENGEWTQQIKIAVDRVLLDEILRAIESANDEANLSNDIDVNYKDGAETFDDVNADDVEYLEHDRHDELTDSSKSYAVDILLRGKRQVVTNFPKITNLYVRSAANVNFQAGVPVLRGGDSVTFALDLVPEGNFSVVANKGDYASDGLLCDDASQVGDAFQVTSDSSNGALEDVTLKLPSEAGEYQLCVSTGVEPYTSLGPVSKFRVVADDSGDVVIEGIRVEEAEKNHVVDGVPSLMEGKEAMIRLFGTGFKQNTTIVFSMVPNDCRYLIPPEYTPLPNVTHKTATYEITAPPAMESATYYICVKRNNGSFASQGDEKWVSFKTHSTYLPLWASILFIIICLVFASLFSGLNLGLMSLDRTELKIIAATGSEKEKKYARIIQPVRDHGNFLLCSILFGNVAVINTHTVILDQLMSGTLAVILSTLSVVLLSEIIPQAICSRHGLAIGAYTIGIMKAVMGITAPLAYPVSKLLDYMLGEEIGNVYNRERLKELVKVTNDVNDLDKEEVNIISGALELRKKNVVEVMTKIEDVYMLSIDDVLDFDTMSDIVKSGYSRIPVYEATRSNIVTVLFVKDLALIDPDDNTPVRRLVQVYQNPCNFVFEDLTLDIMFKQFKEGHKGHMAFIRRVNNQGEGDPFYEVIGLVTLEDVIEELIQAEIVDETDVFMDNRSKRRRHQPNKLQSFAAFNEGNKRENQSNKKISNHLSMATFHYLSTTVDAFRPDVISENVLRRILQQDIYNFIKVKSKGDEQNVIYTLGKPVDYFVLILEGRVEVTVGRESLVFEAGPFTYFGVQALTQNVGGIVVDGQPSTPSTLGSLQNLNMDSMLRHTFVPDYCVRAICDTLYIVIKRSMYLAAKRATLLEISAHNKDGNGTGTQLDDVEVDKLLQQVEDEDVANEKHNANSSPRMSKAPLSRTEELNKSM